MKAASGLSFLAPGAVAVIGASADPKKRGHQALRRLINDGFDGAVYPVHPNLDEILGVPAFASVLDIPGEVDLALVCTPAHTLAAIIEDCGAKGVKGAVVLGAGFGEAGAEGAAHEQAMLDAARRHGVRLVGPNTSGFFNMRRKANLAGIPGVTPGGLGLISQSGNMALAVITEAQRRGLGFSVYAGAGNQADIRFGEYLRFLAEDPDTKTAVLYIEGFKDGREFLDAAREVTPSKPVVVYKSGRTETGRASAKSHTGALAGSYEMSADLLRQAGVTVARRSDHIVPLAECLSLAPAPKGVKAAGLADGGGHAVIAADTLAECGVTLSALSEKTRAQLSKILPPAASLANPVDIAGGADGDPRVFAECVDILMRDEDVSLVLIVSLFGGYALRFDESLKPAEDETAVRLADLQRKHQKPLILQSLYAGGHPAPLAALREGGVPVFESVETAASCAAAVLEYADRRRRNAESSSEAAVEPAPKEGAQALIDAARAEGRASLYEHEAAALAAAHGAVMPPVRLLRGVEDIDAAAAAFAGRPLAVKIVSRDILHKTEAGGVMLGVTGAAEMREAYNAVTAAARNYNPAARIEGVLAAPMAEPGVEVIIGVSRDPVYGLVLMFGLGGVMVEVLKDVVFRAVPLSRADAAEMLDQVQAAPVLRGVRGAAPTDRESLIDLIIKVSNMAHCHPEIAEIDFNPVFAHADGYTVADTRVILKPPDKAPGEAPGGADRQKG